MPVLKSLSFTVVPKTAGDPTGMRRAKFIEKLEEQKLLLADPGYVRTVQRTAEVDGVKQAVVRKQRVKPWRKIIRCHFRKTAGFPLTDQGRGFQF